MDNYSCIGVDFEWKVKGVEGIDGWNVGRDDKIKGHLRDDGMET